MGELRLLLEIIPMS